MTHEIDCEYSNRKYVNEPYCYGADCTEAENEKIFEDMNKNEYICFDPSILSLGLSDECLRSHDAVKYDSDAMDEERDELYSATGWDISVCDDQDEEKLYCTYDYTPYLEAEEEICTKVRSSYA